MNHTTLFQNTASNILPYDGSVIYRNNFLSKKEADDYFQYFLKNIPWQQDVVNLFGKTITMQRKMAWFSDSLKPYTYSNKTHDALPFDDQLQKIKNKITNETDAMFNACLANLYANGGQGMGWHQDNEPEIVPLSAIVSISLGAERPFHFRHIQSGETVKLLLHHGSILIMNGNTQTFWKHQLPKALKVKEQRINFTFRRMK
jgi:alkylated DNA repair dioxygenase AlkB